MNLHKSHAGQQLIIGGVGPLDFQSETQNWSAFHAVIKANFADQLYFHHVYKWGHLPYYFIPFMEGS